MEDEAFPFRSNGRFSGCKLNSLLLLGRLWRPFCIGSSASILHVIKFGTPPQKSGGIKLHGKFFGGGKVLGGGFLKKR